MRRPGIEPGSIPWQGTIMPLDHLRHKGCTLCGVKNDLQGTLFPPFLGFFQLFFVHTIKIPQLRMQAHQKLELAKVFVWIKKEHQASPRFELGTSRLLGERYCH